jgi:exopolysaccharide biosynthesis protein
MTRRRDALVAINTTYFNGQGIPLGLLMKDQELISSPLYNRTLLGITRQQRLFVDQTSLSEAVYFPELRNTQRFHAVNLPRQQQQMVLYTPRYGRSTGTAENEYAFEAQILLDGTIQQTGTHNVPIPEDGYVISAHGKPALWLQQNLHVGMRALIFSQVLGQWRDIAHLISGGPRLLKAGQPHVTSEQEQFKPDIAQGRAPRTALGIGRNGEIILLVVDGRQTRSAGLTLWELAQLLKERGAIEGLNFDGGGSSALAIRGKLVNQPSDKAERPVSSALLVLPDRQRQSRAAH